MCKNFSRFLFLFFFLFFFHAKQISTRGNFFGKLFSGSFSAISPCLMGLHLTSRLVLPLAILSVGLPHNKQNIVTTATAIVIVFLSTLKFTDKEYKFLDEKYKFLRAIIATAVPFSFVFYNYLNKRWTIGHIKTAESGV